jgi:predicted RNA-binding Zn ribbon-like protein
VAQSHVRDEVSGGDAADAAEADERPHQHSPTGGQAGGTHEVHGVGEVHAGQAAVGSGKAQQPATAGAQEPPGTAAAVLAAVATALPDQWQGLKICANPECRWSFYDSSRNRRGTWCDMNICGARAKMRRYRASPAAATRPPGS